MSVKGAFHTGEKEAFAPALEVRDPEQDYVECPHGCGRMLPLRFDVDRAGQLVEFPSPCICHGDCACVAPDGCRVLHCQRCGEPFARRIQRGRLPRYCASCNGVAPAGPPRRSWASRPLFAPGP